MRALIDVALGFAITLAVAGTLMAPGCGTAVTPQLVQCQLSALKVLPKDPKMVTPYDGEDLVNRLLACEREAAGDAGAP